MFAHLSPEVVHQAGTLVEAPFSAASIIAPRMFAKLEQERKGEGGRSLSIRYKTAKRHLVHIISAADLRAPYPTERKEHPLQTLLITFLFLYYNYGNL